MNILKCCSANKDCFCNITKRVFHKHNICSIDCHICTRTNCHTNIRTCKCRSIIYSIADHNNLSFFLKVINYSCLAIRKNSCNHFINTGLTSYCLSSYFVITRKHDYMNAHILYLLYCIRAVFFNRIRNGNNTYKFFTICKK